MWDNGINFVICIFKKLFHRHRKRPMIITTIKILCRQGKRKEIVQTIKGLTEQLIKERGCVKADLYQDLDDQDTLYFAQEWQTIGDLEKHKTSKFLAVLLGLETLLAASVEVKHAVRLE